MFVVTPIIFEACKFPIIDKSPTIVFPINVLPLTNKFPFTYKALPNGSSAPIATFDVIKMSVDDVTFIH